MKNTTDSYWPERLPKSIPVPTTSLWRSLVNSAEQYPDKVALVFFGSSMTFGELLTAARSLAGFMQSRGLKQGDRAMVVMQNCPQLVIAHYAILCANGVVVPVNPMNRTDELKHYIRDSGSKIAITTADLAREIADASDALPQPQMLTDLLVTKFTDVLVSPSGHPDDPPAGLRDWLFGRHPAVSLRRGTVTSWREALEAGFDAPAHVTSSNDLALLPYTSGTTGAPKGCMHRHASLLHNIEVLRLWNRLSAATVMLGAVPMFHIVGIVPIMYSAMSLGACLVIMPRWDRELAAHLIERWQVTSWTNIPPMVMDLLESPRLAEFELGSLHYIGGGGTAMPPPTARRLSEACGLTYLEGYGSTETAGPSHHNPHEAPKSGSLGIPLIGMEAKILDLESLREQPPGEPGEIVVRGGSLFEGYWDRPEDTEKAFIVLDGKRFFRTGDIGKVDTQGYFHMTDRLKRMINTSGYKVWPAEVEMLMYTHPAIQEVCVIATKDGYRGEAVKACVVLREAHASLSAAELIDWCRQNMAVYKAPRSIEFVSSLPKSGAKIMWKVLQEAENSRHAASLE